MKTNQKIGRLAMRVEGDLWCAYYALPTTMADAIFLGSIRMRFVENEMRKAIFMGLMKEAVSDLIEETTGERPAWPEGAQPAPEHERGGNA